MCQFPVLYDICFDKIISVATVIRSRGVETCLIGKKMLGPVWLGFTCGFCFYLINHKSIYLCAFGFGLWLLT